MKFPPYRSAKKSGTVKGTELAQKRRDQNGHEHVPARPAEHERETIVPQQEKRAGHADERRTRHPVGAGRHSVIDSWNAASRHVVLTNFRRAGNDSNDGVNGNRQEHEAVADPLVGNAKLLENGEKDDEREKAARIKSVDLAEVGDEIPSRGWCLLSHVAPPSLVLGHAFFAIDPVLRGSEDEEHHDESD